MTVQTALAALLIFAGESALVAPLLHYLITGWEAKRRDIMDGLSPEARLCYFKMFRRDRPLPTKANVHVAFESLYTEWYGRKFYAFPALLICLSSAIAVCIVVFTVLNGRDFLDNPLFDIPEAAIAALAGAYMWVVNDLVSRARRLDFSPSDVYWANLRLMIAIPMGYAFAALVKDPLAPFIAFALGAFPLATLTSMLRRVASKNLGIDTASEESTDGILKLQGINRTVVERLYNEDISTVPQLAYCDPIRLTMRSNLTFNFVMDCMNQALAWMYFTDAMDTIRPMGLRGAVEIGHLMAALMPSNSDTVPADALPPPAPGSIRISTVVEVDADGRETAVQEIVENAATTEQRDTWSGRARSDGAACKQARAHTALIHIAAALKQHPSTVQIAFYEIANDPYTKFLGTIWGDIAHSDDG